MNIFWKQADDGDWFGVGKKHRYAIQRLRHNAWEVWRVSTDDLPEAWELVDNVTYYTRGKTLCAHLEFGS